MHAVDKLAKRHRKEAKRKRKKGERETEYKIKFMEEKKNQDWNKLQETQNKKIKNRSESRFQDRGKMARNWKERNKESEKQKGRNKSGNKGNREQNQTELRMWW